MNSILLMWVIQKIESKEIEITTRGIPSKEVQQPEAVDNEQIMPDVEQKEVEPKEEKVVLGEEVQYKMWSIWIMSLQDI